MSRAKPLILAILDGWGHSESTEHNAIAQAETPNWDHWWQTCPHTLLTASGETVGLPKGQMGNSEVGHMHIGAGRTIDQDFTRINKAIDTGTFFKNPALLDSIEHAKQHDSTLQIIGLVSPGGVHSHEHHIEALLKLAHEQGLQRVAIHAILDGRDTPPQSAQASLLALDATCQELQTGRIVSIIGRYYAMDRDNRWDRIQLAYELLTQGKAEYHANTAEIGLLSAYDRGEMDEFVKPTLINEPTAINDNDVVVFMNFRSDRARQLSRALTHREFNGFTRHKQPRLGQFTTLTSYAKDIESAVAFPPQHLNNSLGEILSKNNLKQLRIAETEKYAHVTFFFNSGEEEPFAGEQRKLIPSPHVATYDLAPEMSANQVTDKIIQVINDQTIDVIICNFANPDMVGHSGNFAATIKAVECIDRCLGKIVDALQKVNGEIMITSDHGNAEHMYNQSTEQAHTAHTSEPVPLLYIGRPATVKTSLGSLIDIAPTLLYLLNIKKPPVMTGHSLFEVDL